MDKTINQKQLFRLAALIYSQASDNFNEQDTLLSMIEGIMLANDNEPMPLEKIAADSITHYCFIMTEKEIHTCVSQNSDLFLCNVIDGILHYCLYNKYYKQLSNKAGNNIEYYINTFIEQNKVIEVDAFKDSIYKFFYELTTTNITSYQIMFNTKQFAEELLENQLSVDATLFTEEERLYINDFLSWDNDEKNYAITSLIFCCLEYCLIVSGDNANELAKNYITERDVFLDTNIIYRALGINGRHRQEVVRAFLKKCIQANINLYITTFTKREFIDSMKYHVNIAKQFPIRKIYEDAFEDLSDYSIYAYYYNWKNTHPQMNDSYFWTMVDSSLDAMFAEYNISVNMQSFNIYSKDVSLKINEYDALIKRIKNAADKGKDYYYIEEYSQNYANQHDAILIYSAEQKSQETRNSGEKKECLVVSSDKSLRHWDMNRRIGQPPLVVYPSQLFSIVIKICGRSIEDIKSFVSFINIKPITRQISATQANIILSGISTVTEDVNTQKTLISTFIRTSLQTIGASSNNQALYDQTRTLAENYLEQDLKMKENQLVSITAEVKQLNDRMQLVEKSHQKEMAFIKAEKERDINALAVNRMNNERQLRSLATSLIKWKFRRKWIIYPIVCTIYFILAMVFFLSELYPDTFIGFVSKEIVSWYKATVFGTSFTDSLLVLNSVIASLMIYALAYLARHIDKNRRFEAKQKLIESYLNMHSNG